MSSIRLITRWISGIGVALWMALLPLSGVFAQNTTPTPTPVTVTDDTFSFDTLGIGEIVMRGPYDARRSGFNLPADWKLTGGELRLSLSTLMLQIDPVTGASREITEGTTGGSMTVSINGVRLAAFSVQAAPNTEIVIPISSDIINNTENEGAYSVSFVLDTRRECAENQLVEVTIKGTSVAFLPHIAAPPKLSLASLPRPLYQRTFFSENLVLVVPDEPSESELEALMITSAGLGRMTGNRLGMSVRRASDVTAEDRASNLVLIGLPSDLPMLSEVNLINKPQGDSYAELEADDGLVEIAASPWSPTRTVMLISGASPIGTSKAAKAFASRQLLVGEQPSFSVIADVITDTPIDTPPDTQTLSDLGYGLRRISELGTALSNFEFYIPNGPVPGGEPYVSISFAHSALLDFTQSGFVVLINNTEIGSTAFSEESTQVTSKQFTIPYSLIRAGRNTMTVRSTLIAGQECIDRESFDAWMTILPESLIHLPLIDSVPQPLRSLSLGEFPLPFSRQPSLDNTAFMLAPQDPAGWGTAAQIAAMLGAQINSSFINLGAVYGDNIQPEFMRDHDVIAVGRPSLLGLTEKVNYELPAPFDPGSDLAINRLTQVVFRLASTQSVGYLQLIISPWNDQRIILFAQGNNDQGVLWAGTALTNSDLRSRLGGNFAIVADTQIFVGGTRLSTNAPLPTPGSGITSTTTISEETSPALSEFPNATAPEDAPSMAIPLAISIVAIGFLAALAIGFTWWRRKRQSR